jgi:hypothetical protein
MTRLACMTGKEDEVRSRKLSGGSASVEPLRLSINMKKTYQDTALHFLFNKVTATVRISCAVRGVVI